MTNSFDLRRLRYFVKVAELGSLTRAAEALHLAQPALSQQIRALEEELGLELLARGPRGVKLTEAGERMLAEARRLISGMATVVDRVKSAQDPEGQVVIGVGQSIGSVLMGPLLERAAEDLPHVRIQVRELMGGLLPELMRSGAIDFAISLNTVTGQGIRSVAILSEEMCLVGHRRLVERHLKRAAPESLRFSDLQGLPLYLSRRGQFVRETIESAAKSKGVRLDLRAEVDSVHILKELALSGVGCCVLPRTALRRERDSHDLYIGRITAPIIRRDVFLVHRAAMSRAAVEIIALSLETLARLVRDRLWDGTIKARAADIRKTL